MKISFNIGLVEVESCAILKNSIWHYILATIMCFHPMDNSCLKGSMIVLTINNSVNMKTNHIPF
jgi:hypothetical protein